MKTLKMALIAFTLVAFFSSTAFARSISCKDLVDAKWDDIRPFSEGMAAVMKKVSREGANGKKTEAHIWGFINDEGKTIIEPTFQSAGDFHEGAAWVITGSGTENLGEVEVRVINKKGEVLLNANELEKGRYYGAIDCSEGIIGFKTDVGYIDYYDLKGKYIAGSKSALNEDEDFITKGWHFTDGVACVTIKTKEGFNAGYIDKDGEITYLSNQIEEVRPYKNALATALDRTSRKWGVIDKQGKWVIEPQFDDWVIKDQYGYQVFSDDGIAVVKQNGKWGAIDSEGNIVIDIKHNYLSFFKSGYTVFKVNEGDKFGIYDAKGKPVAEALYDGILTKSTDGIIPVLSENKFGYMDISGKEIIKPQYDDLSSFIDGAALVRKNNIYYWIDATGNKIGEWGKSINKLGFDNEAGIIEFVRNGKSGLVKVTVNYIKVLIDGEKLKFDQEPIIKNGRTLVPLRAIFEALGAEVTWDAGSQTITALKDGKTITMRIDDKIMTIGEKKLELDVEPRILNGRTLVPIRAVAESLDAEVTWDSAAQSVIIKKKASEGNAVELMP